VNPALKSKESARKPSTYGARASSRPYRRGRKESQDSFCYPTVGRGAQLDCRATSYRKNHTEASICFCFRRPITSRPWLTMKQANEVGGSVRKGEHSQIVVFWKVDQILNADSDGDSEELEADEKTRRRFVLRYYRLFNLEQCEVPQAALDKLPKIETHQHDPIEAAERIIAGMPNPPETQRAGSEAFYSIITDRVTLPPPELFTTAEEYYATLLHEICAVASVLVLSCGYGAAGGELASNGISAAGAIGPVYKSVVDSCIGEWARRKRCAWPRRTR
jgi:Zincin-like metallopeptidase/N-terminal domain of anti-restriction factor ArdC